ncbi:TetR/AcrR family transcriptional regulator [Bdellovibrio sp. HCB337]|uniref:TetR/AcrR family transcriptional regulator n=1 Tax=Bdellovibrio sp. HCB337 TaxID=3394358 RepID=UPI0039A782EC
MNKRRLTSVVEPRKEPKQERSRQTYQVILQGAMRVIRRDGLQKLSTNKVADESGVSIGSLYQYFPSKQAILAALIDQVFEFELQRMKEAFESLSPKIGARQVIKHICTVYFNIEGEDLIYRRALINSVAAVEKTPEALRFHRAVGGLFIDYLTQNYPGAGARPHAQTIIFIIQYMMRAVAISSVDPEVQELDKNLLLDELAESMMNLLKVPPKYRDVMS